MERAATPADALRAHGLRRTPQRVLVLEAVSRLGHATPEEIAAHVQGGAPEVSLSTVYRALDALVDVGLVARGHLDRAAASYHLVEHADHLHVLCGECAAMAEVPSAEAAALARRVEELSGFSVDPRHLLLRGRCPACRAAATGPGRRGG